jgi:hypothetical protein
MITDLIAVVRDFVRDFLWTYLTATRGSEAASRYRRPA